jgi:hypothetical protein
MTNPTSNFGWQMPTPTDLVTNLPADFEVFGQAVDSDFADLKGGTTGQVLSKTSNTDLDFTWVASNPGDITGVTAGTGISGGGTSGTVTVTNDMATTITASGDIVVGTGSGTYDNLPIGTTGQVLTADTTVSPYKVKWAAASGGSSFVGAKVTRSSAQSLSNDTWTAISYDTEDFDTDGFWTSGSPTRMTIPTGKGGKYLISCVGYFNNSSTSGARLTKVNLNGNEYVAGYGTWMPAATTRTHALLNTVVVLVAGDYLEFLMCQTSGGSLNTEIGCPFAITYLGA